MESWNGSIPGSNESTGQPFIPPERPYPSYDFWPDNIEELKSQRDKLRAYRVEKEARIRQGNFSLEGLPPNPIIEAGHKIYEKLNNIKWNTCNVCLEKWLDFEFPVGPRSGKCQKCSGHGERCRPGVPKTFSPDNDMHPGPVPECLQRLTPVEQAAISMIAPVMRIYRLKYGSTSLHGHVICFDQDLNEFVTRLPRSVDNLGIILLKAPGQETLLKANRFHILEALRYLKNNNPAYKDIEFNFETLSQYPDNSSDNVVGLPEINSTNLTADEGEFVTVFEQNDPNNAGGLTYTSVPSEVNIDSIRERISEAVLGSNANPPAVHNIVNGNTANPIHNDDSHPIAGNPNLEDNPDTVHQPDNPVTDSLELLSLHDSPLIDPDDDQCAPLLIPVNDQHDDQPPIVADEPMDHDAAPAEPPIVLFPNRGQNPVSEFTPGFFSMAFPWLFPEGKADITRSRPGKTPTDIKWVQHLMRTERRFATDQKFLLYMTNRHMRHLALTLGNVFAQRCTRDLTMGELKEKVRSGDDSIFRKLLFFGKQIPGTRQYFKRQTDLAVSYSRWIHIESKGVETFNVFLTFSYADQHMPELHRLLPDSHLYLDKIVVKALSDIPTDANPDDYILASDDAKLRYQNIANNGDIVSAVMHFKLQLVMDHIMKDVLGMVDHIVRCEFQYRY